MHPTLRSFVAAWFVTLLVGGCRGPVPDSPETPSAPDETAVEEPDDDAPPYLLARTVDAEGRPLVVVGLHAYTSRTHREPNGVVASSHMHAVRQVGEGRVRVGPVTRLEGPGPLVVRLSLDETGDGELLGQFRPLRAELPLPDPLPPGELDLGDVVLRAPPLLAAGRVVGPDGEPAPDARLVLRGVLYDPLAEGELRMPVQERRATLRDDGSFEVHGWTLEQHFTLEARHPEWVHGEGEVFARGRRGLVVELRHAGTVRGAVVGEGSDAPRTRLDLHAGLGPSCGLVIGHTRSMPGGRGGLPLGHPVQRGHEDLHREHLHTRFAEGAGAFEFGRVVPGPACLRVSAPGQEERWVHDIEVLAGEATHLTIDLSDARSPADDVCTVPRRYDEVAWGCLRLRHYDVRDLADALGAAAPHLTRADPAPGNPLVLDWWGRTPDETALDRLEAYVRARVQPITWHLEGRTSSAESGYLLITQDLGVHAEIRHVLAELRLLLGVASDAD